MDEAIEAIKAMGITQDEGQIREVSVIVWRVSIIRYAFHNRHCQAVLFQYPLLFHTIHTIPHTISHSSVSPIHTSWIISISPFHFWVILIPYIIM